MKIILNKKIIILLISVIFLLSSVKVVLAEWDGNPYNPGEEDNPECLPSQTNCDVLPAVVTELDPVFSTWLSTTPPLYSYTETDPIFTASAANGITGTNITNWDTAYGWGNHASAGYVTGTPWTAMGYYIGDGSAFAPASHASTHAVGGADAVFPADPGADKYLKFNNTSNLIEWADVGSSSQWTTTGSDIYYNSGNVGIGVITPRTKLELGGDGAILATGTYGSGWTEPNLGAGTRMVWYPRKSAFRAGYVNGTQWNNANIGDYSVAMGQGTIATLDGAVAMGNNTTANNYSTVAMGNGTTASGNGAVAMGINTTASGNNSFAMGTSSNASGSASIAMGTASTASAQSAVAMGQNPAASGIYSAAIGYYAKAESYGSIALGPYNIGGGTAGSWVTTDPLFEIGNGNSGVRSSALMILKNGKVGIGVTTPAYLLTMGTGGGFYNEATGIWVDGSDRSYKENILDLDRYGLETLKELRPVSYTVKQSGVEQVGFIAQEVKEIIPELVSGEDGSMGINYGGFSSVIIKSIQELDLKINEINNFEKENDWRDNLIAWFANVENRITRIFTGEVCLTSPGEEAVCLNRAELQSLKALLNQPTTVIISTSPEIISEPAPEVGSESIPISESIQTENPTPVELPTEIPVPEPELPM